MKEIIENLVETHYNLTSLILSIKQHDDEVNLEDYEIKYINDSYLNVVKALETLIVSNAVTTTVLKSYYTQILKRKLELMFDECDEMPISLDDEESMLKKIDDIYNVDIDESLTADECVLLDLAVEYKICLNVLDKIEDVYSTLL